MESNCVNPWPHLHDFVIFLSRSGEKLVFDCKLCKPKKTTVRAHLSSLNNLKQHMRRAHASKSALFEATIRVGSGRRRERKKLNITINGKGRMDKNNKEFKEVKCEEYIVPATCSTPQGNVDQSITNFFITNMLPLHIVETESFKHLIKSLNPDASSLSGQTLSRRIIEQHIQLKQHLINILGKTDFLATTADCWSAYNKRYLGMTVHWLDPVTRSRMHAVLACVTLEDSSYDAVVKAMIDVYYEFNIDKKVTRSTHDNGNNFMERFMQSENDPSSQYINLEADDAVANLLNQSSDDKELEFISLVNMLTVLDRCECNEVDVLENTNTLPVHMSCAAYTFNLVASKDADDALKFLNIPYKSAMVKAGDLWYLQSINSLAAAYIEATLETKLVVPSTPCWKSTYVAIVALNSILKNKKPVLHKIMTELKIETFSDQDVTFMKEYTKVMTPIAGALDLIRGMGQAYLGSLLPTIAATVLKLKNIISKGLTFCTALANALLTGIHKRFGALLDDEQCQLAAAFHPRFRLVWLEVYDSSRVEQVREVMENNIYEALRQYIPGDSRKDTKSDDSESVKSNDDDNEEDFLNSVTNQKPISHSSFKAKTLLKMWLDMKSNNSLDDEAFMGEEVLINLFIKYNTAIPASAAFKNLFSRGKGTMTPKCRSLSDENFNMLMFVKGNMHLNIHEVGGKPNFAPSTVNVIKVLNE